MRNSTLRNILWVTILVLAVSQSANAGQVTISLPQISLHQNASGVFGVSLSSSESLAGGQMTFAYDSTIGFEITGMKTTARTDGFETSFHQDKSDPLSVKVTLLLYSVTPPVKTISPGEGNIIELTYRTSETMTGTTTVTFEKDGVVFVDPKAAALPVVAQNGSAAVVMSNAEHILFRKSGNGTGTVIIGEDVCDALCKEMRVPYIPHIAVVLKAQPAPDSLFVRWEDEKGNVLNNKVHLQPGKTIIAIFEKK